VTGYCETLFAPSTSTDCGSDADCEARQNGSDTCDTVHGICYRAAALPGDACTLDTECPLGGSCSIGPRFVGGYCQTFGCSPTPASDADECPGAKSTCVQRGGPDEPIAACYEGCGTPPQTCERAGEGYTCASSKSGQPPTICLASGGT
jgi:hypothetical protein